MSGQSFMAGYWHWDYEMGGDPPYYHIYGENGMVAYLESPRSARLDHLVRAVVVEHNCEIDLLKPRPKRKFLGLSIP